MLKDLTNKTLLNDLKIISQKEKKIYLEFLDYLREIDIRAAYVELGFNSLYAYITEGLGYSKDQAYLRINATRIINKVPEVKKSLEQNEFNLSTLATASQIVSMTEMKIEKALDLVKGKSKASAREVVESLKTPKLEKPEQKRIILTVSEEEFELIQEVLKLKNKDAKELLITKCKEERRKLEKEKKITLKESSRHIPISVKREILTRAKFQCEHSSCKSKKHLQYAHIRAYSKGGGHEASNIKLLCHAHHKFETFQEFGRRVK